MGENVPCSGRLRRYVAIAIVIGTVWRYADRRHRYRDSISMIDFPTSSGPVWDGEKLRECKVQVVECETAGGFRPGRRAPKRLHLHGLATRAGVSPTRTTKPGVPRRCHGREMLDWRGKVLARMDLIVLGFQGGGERRGSEIEPVVTRHPRTLVVHDSCAQRVSRRQGTRLSGAVLITSLPIDIRHFAQDVLVQIRYAHRCLSSVAYRAGTLTTSDRGCRDTDLSSLNHATPRHPVSTQNQQIHFHHRAAHASPLHS